MADIKFKIPERYNMDLAEQGVEFRVEDDENNYYGTFMCRHLDQDSPAYRRKQEQFQAEYMKANRNLKASEDDLKAELFIRAVLVGWKDVTDENDKPVPFNEKNARAYFGSSFTKFVRNSLLNQASEAINFKVHNKNDVAGN